MIDASINSTVNAKHRNCAKIVMKSDAVGNKLQREMKEGSEGMPLIHKLDQMLLPQLLVSTKPQSLAVC